MKSYKASLTSEGLVNNVSVYLEELPDPGLPLPMPIYLKPISMSKTKWEMDSIEILVVNRLDYEVRVQAYSGTKWKFTLVNEENSAKVLELEGRTGEDGRGSNISIKRGNTSPNTEPRAGGLIV
jgi:hypothetical protein